MAALTVGLGLLTLLGAVASAHAATVPAASAAGPRCQPAGDTGLTARVVARAGQVLSGTYNAAGCDVGIYIGPHAGGAQVIGASVFGANDHGIFVQDAAWVTIKYTQITDNGNPSDNHLCTSAPTSLPVGCDIDDKEVELIGTSHALFEDNSVTGNLVDGGISVADDGPIDSAAPNEGHLSPSLDNTIIGNSVSYVFGGCDVLLTAWNQGAGAHGNVIEDNTVLGFGPGGPSNFGSPPGFGAIIVATNYYSTSITDTTIVGNTIVGSLVMGIVIDSDWYGGVVRNTLVEGNYIAHTSNASVLDLFENPLFTPPLSVGTVGILLCTCGDDLAPGGKNWPVETDTTITYGGVWGDNLGVWLCGTTDTTIEHLHGNFGVQRASCTTPGGS